MPSSLCPPDGGEGACRPPPGLGALLGSAGKRSGGGGGPPLQPGKPKEEQQRRRRRLLRPPPPPLLPLSPPPPPPPRPPLGDFPKAAEEGAGQEPAATAVALRFALDQLSLLGLGEEKGGQEEEEEEERKKKKAMEGPGGGPDGGEEEEDEEEEGARGGSLDHLVFAGASLLPPPPPPATPPAGGLLLLDPDEGSPPAICAASPAEIFGAFHPHLGGPHPPPPPHPLLAGPLGIIGCRKKSVNMTECVSVPSSEHVAEIVGRQGCKIKALRAKTNTYIKTPVRGEEPVFIVTGRKEDVEMAQREILSAAKHFSMIRATRNKVNGVSGSVLGPPNLPGQTTIQVRVPYRVVGLVVGPKGATIKRIQQQTHTYIVTPSRDKEPVFEVTGMPENVDRAREEIEAHITMRTGSFIDISTDNDFHSNGTDVCLDLLGGSTSGLWAKAPNPARRPLSGLRGDNLASLGNATSVTEPYFGGHVADGTPNSPFGTGTSFPFTEPQAPVLSSDNCDFGFDFLALDLTTPTTIWSPFEPSGNPLQAFSSSSSINGASQRCNSSLSSSATPRHSPTLPETSVALEHPLARRIQSDPVSALSWLPTQGSLSSFSNSTGYSSSSSLPSSVSATSGSPTDSSGSDGARKSSRECMVCFESEVIAALVPCGHNLFCMECAMRICGKAEPECPACHTPATQAIHIFS
ncbi:RNA-binding protein MEX3D [Hemicordylus capensis]|uniref:RNA-binding protein MEX3D n=1 Tax=Hemicordylus capensis TaxID=884348 RepID=UPI002302727B|nr:RNA-binding protein MEX3D [Hemicordylus capensis]